MYKRLNTVNHPKTIIIGDCFGNRLDSSILSLKSNIAPFKRDNAQLLLQKSQEDENKSLDTCYVISVYDIKQYDYLRQYLHVKLASITNKSNQYNDDQWMLFHSNDYFDKTTRDLISDNIFKKCAKVTPEIQFVLNENCASCIVDSDGKIRIANQIFASYFNFHKISSTCFHDCLPYILPFSISKSSFLFLIRQKQTIIKIDFKKSSSDNRCQILLIPFHFNEFNISCHLCLLLEDNEIHKFDFLTTSNSNTDFTTGLPDKSLLYERTKLAITRAKRNNSLLAIIFIDLDDFKYINDNYGHETGDNLLHSVARILKSIVRDQDLVVRYGGDEFVILLEDMQTENNAAFIANKIQQSIQKPLCFNEIEINLSTSIGISVYPNDGSNCYDLIRKADLAMYESKQKGKNTITFYTSKLDLRIQNKLKIHNELQKALYGKELVIYYQPIVDFINSKVTGVEALIRWNHPKYGLLTPHHFIGVAEESGLIQQIGFWVLQEACS